MRFQLARVSISLVAPVLWLTACTGEISQLPAGGSKAANPPPASVSATPGKEGPAKSEAGKTDLVPPAATPPAASAQPNQPAITLADPKASSTPPAPATAEKTPATPAKAVASKPASDPKAVEIVNRYLDALGGLKMLEAIEDRTTKFKVIKHAPTGETTAAMNLFLKKGFKIREEWDIEGLKIKDKPLAFVQVYNGSEGWVQMFGTVSPLEGKTLSLFVWDKLLDDFFCHWEDDGYALSYAGSGTVDNEACDVVDTTDFSGQNKAKYYFSKQSGLLLKREWREQGQQGMATKQTLFKKYKKLSFADGSGKGVQFPLEQQVYEDGDLDTSRVFYEVAFNTGLKDAIFERPEGEEFKGAIQGGKSDLTPTTAPATPGAHPKVGGGHPAVGPGAKPMPKPEIKKADAIPGATPPSATPTPGATPPAPAPAEKAPEKK